QMMALAEEVKRRGGTPLDPLVYKSRYLDRLSGVIHHRLEELRGGHCPPGKYLVPGARAFLETLKDRGLHLYLASGTDDIYMREEAGLLDISRYFDGGIYGALDDLSAFSKRILVQRIVRLPGVRGEQLIAFGDGYVEIEEVKRVGGITVGVATDEPECQTVDQWKRTRLIGVGADYIIPNFECREEILSLLFGESPRSHYPLFDRSRLLLQPLAQRTHDLKLDYWLDLTAPTPAFNHPDLEDVAGCITEARAAGAARILMMGAHVIRSGVNRHIIDLLERGFIDHIAMNG